MDTSQLENRVVLLARVETTEGQDSIKSNLPGALATDAFLCSALDVKTNTTVLERNNYSPSLSKDATGVSKTLLQLTFTHELRASGVFGTAPRMGRLLKACGFAETAIANTAAATISNPVAGSGNTSNVMTTDILAAAKTTAPTSRFDTYRLTAILGGVAGVFTYLVTGPGFHEGDATVLASLSHTYEHNSAAGVVAITGTAVAPIFTFSGTWVDGEFVEVFVGGIRFFYQVQVSDTVTSIATAFKAALLADGRFTGTDNTAGVLTVALTTAPTTSSASTQVVTLGASGAQLTLPASMTGTVIAGEYIDIALRRPGVRYDPVSDNVTSLTFYVYLDGALYILTGAKGTFKLDGAAGQYALAQFTFTGLYNDPIDAALPTAMVFESSKPYKVELSQLAVSGMANAVASKFSFDIANTINPRDDINQKQGIAQLRLTDRTPVMGCDPESSKPSVFNPWWRMEQEDTSRMHVEVGAKGRAGNIVHLNADRLSYTDTPFADRNGIRAWQFNFRCARVTPAGNDECSFTFA